MLSFGSYRSFHKTFHLNLTKTDQVDVISVATEGQLFQLNGALYEQTDGMAMGSSRGLFLANVLEENLKREGKLCYLYRRYVGDPLSLMPNITKVSNFIEELNKAHSSVKSTIETESNGMLPFLGIQLLKRALQRYT